jgi:hypothetical protein
LSLSVITIMTQEDWNCRKNRKRENKMQRHLSVYERNAV